MTLRLSTEQYMDIGLKILKAVGVKENKAKCLVANLLRADLRGITSHGINNFHIYVKLIERGVLKPNREPRIVLETPNTALIDGNEGLGQFAFGEAAKLVAKKAKKKAVSLVGVKNCGHAGHIGDYTRMIIGEGLIGIAYVNVRVSVAPYGGKNAILGTNPISYALPAGRETPIIVDFATSKRAAGRISGRLARKEKIPKGWVIDSSGNDTTDPHKLFKDLSIPLEWGSNFLGALLPTGGYKGYALGLVADVFAGAVTGGRCNGNIRDGENLGLIQAIDPAVFVSKEEYQQRIDELIKACRASSPRPGFDKVIIPGDPEREAEKENLEKGIPISYKIWKYLCKLGQRYELKVKEIVK